MPDDFDALLLWYHISAQLPSRVLRQTSHAKLALLKPQLIFSSKLLCSPFLGLYGNAQHPANSTSQLRAHSALIHLRCLKNRLFSLYNVSKTRVLLPADVPTSLTQFHCSVSQTHYGCPKWSPTPEEVKEPKSNPNMLSIIGGRLWTFSRKSWFLWELFFIKAILAK